MITAISSVGHKAIFKAGLLLWLALGSSLAAAATGVLPQANYPARPVRLIVPQNPGGGTDLYARLIALPLSERIGQPIVVDNRAGAGSLLGTALVAKAVPDGYTLLAISSAFTIIPSMYKAVPYDSVRDFAGVALTSSYPQVVVVHPSLPVNSIKELIALAKAKPGVLNFSSAGVGAPTQLIPELFKYMAGVDIVHVPYSGGGPAISALIGGQVQLAFGPIATVMPQVKAGKLRALAVTSAKRSSILPDLPSVAEAGVPGFEQSSWNGLLAPARTPAAVIGKLNNEVNAVLKTAAIRERYAIEGVEVRPMSPGEFDAMLKAEIAKWAQVIKHAGIQPE